MSELWDGWPAVSEWSEPGRVRFGGASRDRSDYATFILLARYQF